MSGQRKQRALNLYQSHLPTVWHPVPWACQPEWRRHKESGTGRALGDPGAGPCAAALEFSLWRASPPHGLRDPGVQVSCLLCLCLDVNVRNGNCGYSGGYVWFWARRWHLLLDAFTQPRGPSFMLPQPPACGCDIPAPLASLHC